MKPLQGYFCGISAYIYSFHFDKFFVNELDMDKVSKFQSFILVQVICGETYRLSGREILFNEKICLE